MSSVNRDLLRLLGEITRNYSLETLHSTGFDQDITMDEAERIWTLGIQQLPPQRSEELADRAADGMAALQYNQVIRQLGNWGMLPKAQLEEQLENLPGDASGVISRMTKDGLVTTFKLEEDGNFTEFVSLTGEGCARYEKRHARAEGLSDEFLAPLSEDERLQLYELLGKLV